MTAFNPHFQWNGNTNENVSLSQPTSKLSRTGGGKRACWQAIVITHILLISQTHHNTLIFQSEFTVTDGP